MSCYKNPDNKLCIGLDFGFTHDPTALCCSLINDTTKEIHIFDEAYRVGLITKEVAKMIKDKGVSSIYNHRR